MMYDGLTQTNGDSMKSSILNSLKQSFETPLVVTSAIAAIALVISI